MTFNKRVAAVRQQLGRSAQDMLPDPRALTSAECDQQIEAEFGAELFETLSRPARFAAMADRMEEIGRSVEAGRWRELTAKVSREVTLLLPDNGSRGTAVPRAHRPGEPARHGLLADGSHAGCSHRCNRIENGFGR